MSRKTFDPDADMPLPPHGQAPLVEMNPPLPCKWCGALTQRADLTRYGARCFKCYVDYCNGLQEPKR